MIKSALFFAVSQYPLTFFANTLFKGSVDAIYSDPPLKKLHLSISSIYLVLLIGI